MQEITPTPPVLPPDPTQEIRQALQQAKSQVRLDVRRAPDGKHVFLITPHGPLSMEPLEALGLARAIRAEANRILTEQHERQAKEQREKKRK